MATRDARRRGTRDGRDGAGLGLVLAAIGPAYLAGLTVWLLGHGWAAALATLVATGPLLTLGMAAGLLLRDGRARREPDCDSSEPPVHAAE